MARGEKKQESNDVSKALVALAVGWITSVSATLFSINARLAVIEAKLSAPRVAAAPKAYPALGIPPVNPPVLALPAAPFLPSFFAHPTVPTGTASSVAVPASPSLGVK